MSKLVYITNMSLDGYIEDATGAFDWIDSVGVFQFITELLRPIGTYLYGRRLYETMAYWETAVEDSAERREFASIWQNAEKVVFSRTLTVPSTRNTRVERHFEADAIARLKRESLADITIGGADLAAHALDADLVDELGLFLYPVILGRGKPAFQNRLPRHLELLDARNFDSGVVYVHYRVGTKHVSTGT